MSEYSPYAVNESEPPKWNPGEDLAAAAFIGMALWLILDVCFGIVRVFKRKKGLYYWSCQIGILGCLSDAVGVIFKYLVPGSKAYWPLYTLLLLVGMAFFAPFQLLVLYSRLHLVNNNHKIQKLVLYTILSTYITIILPTWVVVWYAYNPNPAVTSLWSPRDAIVERYTQIGLTLVECLVSGIYIWSLLRLLSHKSTVRQRCVMRDLIYVNLICIAFDVLTIIFIYLNRLGISHPVQTFSYALKFKLEFVVLNQLMAVAARGLRKTSWEERRYNNTSETNDFSAECRKWTGSANPASLPMRSRQEKLPDNITSQSIQDLSIRPSISSQSNRTSTVSTSAAGLDPTNLDLLSFGAEPKLELKSFSENQDEELTSPIQSASTVDTRPSQTFSGDTLHSTTGNAREQVSPRFSPRRLLGNNKPLQSILERAYIHRKDREKIDNQPSNQSWKGRERHQGSIPINATLRKHNPNRKRQSTDEDDEEEEEEEIGVHMWENRGKVILDAPWFKSKEEPV